MFNPGVNVTPTLIHRTVFDPVVSKSNTFLSPTVVCITSEPVSPAALEITQHTPLLVQAAHSRTQGSSVYPSKPYITKNTNGDIVETYDLHIDLAKHAPDTSMGIIYPVATVVENTVIVDASARLSSGDTVFLAPETRTPVVTSIHETTPVFEQSPTPKLAVSFPPDTSVPTDTKFIGWIDDDTDPHATAQKMLKAHTDHNTVAQPSYIGILGTFQPDFPTIESSKNTIAIVRGIAHLIVDAAFYAHTWRPGDPVYMVITPKTHTVKTVTFEVTYVPGPPPRRITSPKPICIGRFFRIAYHARYNACDILVH